MADIGTGYVPEESLYPIDKPPPDPDPPPPPNPDGDGGDGDGGNGDGGSGGDGGGDSGGGSDGGGSDGGGSSGGGSSGGGGSSKPQDRYAAYLKMLEDWFGINGVPDALVKMAHTAAEKHWAFATFQHFVRGTEFYQNWFQGIQVGQSEGAYNNMVTNYKTQGNRIGESVNRHQVAWMIGHNVGIAEFTDRVTAVQRVDDNRATMREFERVLRARGAIGKNQQVTDENLYRFVLHAGPENWKAIWDETQVRYAAATAGFEVGHNITRQAINRIANRLRNTGVDLGGREAMQDFANLAQGIRTLKATGRLVGDNWTRRDIEELAFGGPRQGVLRQRAEATMAKYKTALTTPPQPQLVQTAEGARLLGGLEGLGGSGFSTG